MLIPILISLAVALAIAVVILNRQSRRAAKPVNPPKPVFTESTDTDRPEGRVSRGRNRIS